MTAPIIDLRDPRFQEDRFKVIEALRAQSFYARTAEGATVFLNHEDAVEVLACQNYRFAFNQIDETRSPYLAKAIQHELLNMHGEAHNRLSRLVKMALRDRIIEGLSAQITQIVAELLATFPDKGEVEFCSAFANPLPARILGPMFGVPYEDTEGLNDWIRIGGRKVDALQSGVGIDKVEEANRKLHDYLRALLERKRTDDGDDLFSELMRVEIDGDRMSTDELVYLTAELASAGVDTTRA